MGRRSISVTVIPWCWATRLWASSWNTTQAKRATSQARPATTPGPSGVVEASATRPNRSRKEAWTRMSIPATVPNRTEKRVRRRVAMAYSGATRP